jgi:penicillin-binding protein 2
MQDDLDRYTVFSRRALLLGVGKVGLFSILLGRLYYLQVLESAKYSLLAKDNSIKVRLLVPPRGQIVDAQGRLLVTNANNFKVVASVDNRPQLKKNIQRVSEIIEISEDTLQQALRESRRRWRVEPFTIKENLSWSEVTALEMQAPDLQGVAIEVGLNRAYLFPELLSHITGYVSSVSQEEQDKTDDPLLHLQEFRIGKAGVEKAYDTELRGIPGTREVEVNALGRVVREISTSRSTSGRELQLTIDLELQKNIVEALKSHRSASVVVMDVNTGAVKALVSVPGYDPNKFTNGIPAKLWNNLLKDPLTPLQNKAIAGIYGPGSTYKMAVALAALESGAITPNTHFYCPGYMNFGNHRFHCWRHKERGHGSLNVVGALRESCDIFFYEAARLTGIEKIAEMSLRLGLGQKTGIEIPGEKNALIPTPEWKWRVKKQKWYPSETIIAGIGQGYVLATPLQLALMTARIANGGRLIVPHLYQPALGTAGDPLPVDASWNVAPKDLALVRQGMYEVVNHARGTATRASLGIPGMEMAGKTGTTQVRRITMYERAMGITKSEQRPWKDREHAIFVGYAPFDNPQYAVAVVIEHGGGGSRYAGPVAKAAMRLALGYPATGEIVIPESKPVATQESPELESSEGEDVDMLTDPFVS